MENASAVESVALCRFYKNGEEMIALTGWNPLAIDSDDARTWPPYKIERTINIDCLAGGSFAVRDGDRWNECLTFDEMLGTVACLTMPEHKPCLQWMETKEQHDAREEHYAKLRKERQTTPQTNE